MAGLWDTVGAVAGGGIFSKSLRKKAGKFLFGTPEKRENVSLLRPYQEDLHRQSVEAAQNPGAGGAFGDVADYYRGNLSYDPRDYQAMAAPTMREYYQDIMPNITEQFAGMGSGALSSSGFRNAQTQGAVDLAERLAQMRANLRQQAAQGLFNVGQQGLNSYTQNMTTQPGTPGLLPSIAPAVGTAAGAAFGGPAGAAIGNMFGNWMGGMGNNATPKASASPNYAPRPSLPQFSQPTNWGY